MSPGPVVVNLSNHERPFDRLRVNGVFPHPHRGKMSMGGEIALFKMEVFGCRKR